METRSDMDDSGNLLMEIYERMKQRFGFLDWWPGDSPFEVCVGAILTQNTSWTNVEKAIANLKEAGALSVVALSAMEETALAELIRPSGYYNQKARKLKTFLKWLNDTYDGDLREMSKTHLPKLREQLLALNGIGPETADSILLYAADKPSFVVDAYTKRIFSRHALVSETANYDQMKEFFESRLPLQSDLFKDYHAQIVQTGKHYCHKKEPSCEECPLEWLWDERS